FVGLSLLLVALLAAVDVAVLRVKNPLKALGPHYYMALGDSLSFGYQPNLDFSAGFVDDIYTNTLRPAGATGLVNDACAGETTETMINGGCVARFAHHGSYTGAQLDAALSFLNDPRHKGRVSPVTLEIGVNDVIKDWNPATCSVGQFTENDLATMDTNLTTVILPKLVKALATPTGAPAGDLHLLNYYNPYAKECPNSVQFVHELNDHLAADAAQFRIPVVDVYNAFGGDTGTVANLCDLTWMCNAQFHDIHPSNKGYAVIAQAVEKTLGLPGTNPVTGSIAPPALPSGFWPRVAWIRSAV
ncbi:MAG: SGNH/GDSL hydrolase family protein, partial [Chloroflexota bacterium]|nr:SGNH/GDSL hydrolase family protein [Chloroflexota bacterium]